jgi:hypothetical protein
MNPDSTNKVQIMTGKNLRSTISWIVLASIITALTITAGCASTMPPTQSTSPIESAHVAGVPDPGQMAFDGPQPAADALVQATKNHDRDTLHKVFGPAGHDLVSGDRVEDRNAREAFAQKAAEQLTVTTADDGTRATLYIGKDSWPFPIPLIKTADAKWYFDTEAGKQEILARRIGGNELNTISVCRACVQAQRDYAAEDHNGSQVLQYAQHLVSTPGQQDGLYWDAAPAQPQSPLGPLMAQAALEGYSLAQDDGRQPFHGYYFRILTRQGPAVPGGQYNYIINGNMIAGFALVACPARYGSSGIMTFVVNHQGKVYQKDLGPDTRQIVANMSEYNPDSTWTLVKD